MLESVTETNEDYNSSTNIYIYMFFEPIFAKT